MTTFVQIVACPAAEIAAMLPLAEQYYHEDKLPFDAARFQRAVAAALAQDRAALGGFVLPTNVSAMP